jgi:spermidine/putrescine transport system ATP-binding protein
MSSTGPAHSPTGVPSGRERGRAAEEHQRASVLNVVELVGASKRYAPSAPLALDEVSLGIREGEFFSLLGPSGSGKTTTLRLIAGFEPATSGTILLDGFDVTRVPPFRRDVNTVFQNYALFPHMTVRNNVSYPLRMRRVARGEITARMQEALALVEMSGYESRMPHELSGGQRQRVALARALVGRPKVLLLDEPLGALDLQLRQQMQLALKQLQREVGITFIYVTHDQGEALAMSDRLAVMADGRLEQIGTPEEVYSRPATRFVAGFIGKANLLECTVVPADSGSRVTAGPFVLDLPERHEPGNAIVSIRYEAIAVSPAPADSGEPGRSALVRDVVFLGDGRELILDVGNAALVARVAGAASQSFAAGDRVGLSIDTSNVAIIRE